MSSSATLAYLGGVLRSTVPLLMIPLFLAALAAKALVMGAHQMAQMGD